MNFSASSPALFQYKPAVRAPHQAIKFHAWLSFTVVIVFLATGCDREKARLERHVQDIITRLNAIDRKPSAAVVKVRQEYEELRKSKSPETGRYAALVLLGQSYTLDGSYDKALEYYREAQKLLGNTADAYYAMGDAYYELVLLEPALDRKYRFDSAQPVVPIQSRDRAQTLLAAALRQYELGHQHKTFQEQHPGAPRDLTSKPRIEWREKQAKNFVKDNAQQILLHQSDAPKLTSWAMHFNFNRQAKAGDKAAPSLARVARPLPEIMREIQPDLKLMMKTVTSHKLLQKKAAEYRKKNQAGIADLKHRATRDPKDATPKFALGYVYMIQMDYDVALKEYEKGCDLLPTALDCWAGLGRVLYNVAASYMTVKDVCAPLPPNCKADAPAKKTLTAADEILEMGADKLPLTTKWERGSKILQAASNPAAVASLRENIRIALKRE